jgi:hypothetical protein
MLTPSVSNAVVNLIIVNVLLKGARDQSAVTARSEYAVAEGHLPDPGSEHEGNDRADQHG